MICTLLRKPLNGGGILSALPCGVLGIGLCRVPLSGSEKLNAVQRSQTDGIPSNWRMNRSQRGIEIPTYNPQGRFPANVLCGGSVEIQFFLRICL